jgi:hypothetical protein
MPTPSVPEDESAQFLTRHRHGRRRKKKRSKRFKNILTVVVLFIMVLVIVWFLVSAIMDLGGSHAE